MICQNCYSKLSSYLKHYLSEVLLVKLTEFSQAELAEVREEDPPLLLDLALHVHHLLLGGGDAEGVQGL